MNPVVFLRMGSVLNLSRSNVKLIFLTSISEAQGIRVQIGSDSIDKYVKDVRHTEVCAFPGINNSRLTNKLQNRHLVLNKIFSIIHVGTNNILSLSAGEIVLLITS